MSRQTRLGSKLTQRGRPARTLPGKFLWILLVSLSAMAFVLSPAKDIFVLNHEQKQCARFWPGDEYVYYAPPEPWQKAESDENGMIHTQFGSCNLKEVDIYNPQNVEACCQKLGYTYIGELKGVVEKRDYGLSIGLYLFVLPVLIFKNWFPIVIFLVVIYFLRKWFKKNANEQKTTGEQNDA
jgi:hypothetical protein